MAPSDVQQQQLPFLSTVNAANIVPTKLFFSSTGTNYQAWKEQILRLIESQGLPGFIDGTKAPPPETDTDDKNQDYGLWRRTDMLLRGWILCSLNDDVVDSVSAMKTSRAVWLGLEGMSQLYLNSDPSTSDQTVEAGRDYVQENFDYLQLSKAAHQGDWEAAKQILDSRPDGSGKNILKRNALLNAAATGKSNHFVQKLINESESETPYEFIIPTQKYGDTALTAAVTVGNTQLANFLVTKMSDLLYIPNDFGDFPVQIAALHAERDILEYLISVTKKRDGVDPYTGSAGCRLLLYVIDAEFLDIALSLVEEHPELATLTIPDNDTSALKTISSKKSIFCSERRFTFWERFISPRVSLDTTLRPQFTTGSDIQSITHNEQAVFQRLHVMLWEFVEGLGLVKSIKEKTMLKLQALKLVKVLCKEIEKLGYEEATDIYFNACVIAAELGIHEVVEEILQVFPNAIHCSTRESKQHLLHVAVQNRCERVYNLLFQMGDCVRLLAFGDSDGNNVLHLAGKLAPSHKLDEISGAALQMQYELQWYKELEKFGNLSFREAPNKARKSPKMVFTEEHKQLKEEGEKWMKDTANSCTIAAALIATVMFAAAITVPGGTDSSKGFPIFSSNAAFIVFAISDAVSLFTSATSLLMFLAILTSRYAAEDFLRVLPKRLIIGLGTLFLSITFMMVSFSATIYLVFGRQKAWVLIPVGGLACLPVASFVLLQFPLLRDLISSTYGSGMFPKQRTPLKIRPSQISSKHHKAEA